MTRPMLALVAGLLALAPSHAGAQQEPPEKAPARPARGATPLDPSLPAALNPPLPEAQRVRMEDLPPSVRLGVRVAALREKIPTRSAVVVVPDGAAFVDAIGTWSVDARFPVLIDDGSSLARENIARFVRAFQPGVVLRWAGGGEAWAESIEARRDRAMAAIADAWGAESVEKIGQRWSELGFAPPGVIVASAEDPAWVAAVALGAGHGQPVVWTNSVPDKVGGEMDPQTAGALNSAAADMLRAGAVPFEALGDVVDGLTLCLNVPTKVAATDGPRALTDYVGRNPDGSRWAWAGIVYGDEAEAAYRAMCSLYLSPTTAWLFDGYPASQDTAAYANVRQAGNILRERGVASITDQDPRATVQAWRDRARGGVDAGFIHVNSTGQRRWFRLGGENADASEIPMLRAPSVVHFIHSFSAQNPSDRSSIAARFLENGAYVYVGSVDEPYLTAFQTPMALAARLVSHAPIGAAVRQDAGQAWKINVLGDPLTTFCTTGPRIDEPPALEGAESVEASMKASLEARRVEDAILDLVLLGRDVDAVRLFASAVTDKSTRVTPEMAATAFAPACRVGDLQAIIESFESMSRADERDEQLLDSLWQNLRPALGTNPPDGYVLACLRKHLRKDLVAEDAMDLASAIRRLQGAPAARAFLQEAAQQVKNQKARQRLLERAAAY